GHKVAMAVPAVTPPFRHGGTPTSTMVSLQWESHHCSNPLTSSYQKCPIPHLAYLTTSYLSLSLFSMFQALNHPVTMFGSLHCPSFWIEINEKSDIVGVTSRFTFANLSRDAFNLMNYNGHWLDMAA
ncbi:hypothetical protein HAX54_033994, partial [Datura stramonium]|nr:hypothetical protein [Datura stramonium]